MNIGFIILQSAFRFATILMFATTTAYVACGMYIILKRLSFTFVQQQSNSRERAVKTLLRRRRKKKSIKRFLTAAIKEISLKKILLSKKKKNT